MTIWMPNKAALPRPAYLSLAEQFARAVEDGHLPPGTRLMPHRKLADALGLSVQTVSRAYDELIRRNLVAGEVGRGTYVLPPSSEARQPYLPERPGEVIDLSILKPVVGQRQVEEFRQGFAWLAENLSASSALSFRPKAVMPRHWEVAAGWLRALGIPAVASGVVISNGVSAALSAAVMGVVPPGGGLAAESLTHHTIKPLCNYLGLHLEAIAMDAEGMLPEALDEVAARGALRAVYLQPNVINPLAHMMGGARRAELVDVARRHDLAIIENDSLNLLLGDRPPALAALAPERTIYLCGFSKITFPGLRLAYLHAPARFAVAVANRHLVAHWMATPAMVELLSYWVEAGKIAELVSLQMQALEDRHRIAAEALGPLMPAVHGRSLHLWLALPEAWTEEGFVAAASQRGVAVAAGQAFRISEKGMQAAVRISLGSTGEDDLRKGLGLLAGLLSEAPEAPLLTI
ncbi:PLP-dependent aminotransferase family protein [Thioclava sp. FR2]|uniref:MocR-like ectoine utilization transcription factor EhuR n=1 Tax=Thioclava sp. FR2 TaxID=3445780 RepID=UPI003EBCD63E